MAENYGLLGGMAAGIREGLAAYQTVRQNKRLDQMANLTSGVQEGEDGNLEFTPEMKAQKDQQIKDTQTKARESDPTSPESQAARQYHSVMTGKQIPDNISAAQLKEYGGLGAGVIKNQGLIGSAQIRADASTDNAQIKADKVGVPKSTDWYKFDDAINPNKARAGALAKSQAVINASQRLEGIFQQFPDGNIPKAQTVELATAAAALYSGGSPQSQHQVDMIVPSSATGSAQDLASWFMNDPRGRQQQQFIQVLKEGSEREKKIAAGQIHDAQAAEIPAHPDLYRADPKRFRKMLKGRGFDDSEIDENGDYAQKKPQGLLNQGAQNAGPKAVKKQYSPSTNKTYLTMEDGTVTAVDGKQ